MPINMLLEMVAAIRSSKTETKKVLKGALYRLQLYLGLGLGFHSLNKDMAFSIYLEGAPGSGSAPPNR